VEHAHSTEAAHPLRVYHESAVMRAYQPSYPNVTGSAIHLHLGDLRDDGWFRKLYAIPRPVRIVPAPTAFGEGACPSHKTPLPP